MFNPFKKSQEKQFVPTIEEVEDKQIKSLASRLKTSNLKETLTNILEWQDRNLKFWEERWLTYMIFIFIAFFSIITLYLYLEGVNSPVAIIMLIGFILVAILGKNILNFILNLVVLFIFIIVYVLLLSSLIPVVSIPSKTFIFIIAISLMLGGFISLIFNLVMKYRNIKSLIPDFKIDDTFKLSLPVQKILSYRLSVCRDYAKLTSALLLNIYPKNEIYFALIPQHVATAIKIDGKMYVLDQRLPVRTLEGWTEIWMTKLKRKKLNVKFVKVFRENGELKTMWIKEKYLHELNIQNKNKSSLDRIVKELKSIFMISESKAISSRESLTIPLKNSKPAIYESDEIVIFSILEAIKNRIEDELVGQVKNIKNLEIVQKDKDLLIKIWLK